MKKCDAKRIFHVHAIRNERVIREKIDSMIIIFPILVDCLILPLTYDMQNHKVKIALQKYNSFAIYVFGE